MLNGKKCTLKSATALQWTLEYGTICAMVWWQGCAVAAQTQISLQGRSPTRCRPLVVHHEVHREDGVTLGSPRPPRVRSPHPPRVTLGSTRIAFSSPPPSLGGCQPYVWETYLLKKVKSTEFLISCRPFHRRVSNPCYPTYHELYSLIPSYLRSFPHSLNWWIGRPQLL